MARLDRGRQNWTRVGHLIIHKPWWRAKRNAWFVRIRNCLSGVVEWRRIDLPGLPPSKARLSFDKACEAAKALVPELEHVKKLTTGNLFEKAIEAFLDYKKPDLRSNSHRDLSLTMRSFARDLAGRIVESIAWTEIDQVIRDRTWRGTPISKRTRTRLRSHIHSFFSWAVDRKLCRENPVTRDKKTRGGAERSENKLAFAACEASKLLSMALERDHHSDLSIFLATSLLSGIRPEGIARLRWKDIRFETGMIILPSDASKTHTELELPLHSGLSIFLRKALTAKMPVAPDDTITTTGVRSILTQYKKLISALTKTATNERAALLSTATLRTCRRSFASWLEPLISFAALQILMGHKQGSGLVTLRYVIPDELRASIEKLPALLPPSTREQKAEA